MLLLLSSSATQVETLAERLEIQLLFCINWRYSGILEISSHILEVNQSQAVDLYGWQFQTGPTINVRLKTGAFQLQFTTT